MDSTKYIVLTFEICLWY